jgi:hypothetical protein
MEWLKYWEPIIASLAPIVLGGFGFLATENLEYTRMDKLLKLYGRVPDWKTKKNLAEAIRAESWKTTQPFLWRHPTMYGIAYFLFFTFAMVFS